MTKHEPDSQFKKDIKKEFEKVAVLAFGENINKI